MGHSALLGAIYLAAFVSTCALLGLGFPYPNDSDARAKVEYLAKHGDDYDVLFIGSSRVHQQIIPAIFDKVAGENGVPVRSFNAGLTAMFSPEEGYMLEEILRRPHRRLRWVFVELMALSTDTRGEHTSRFTYWHDTPRLVLAARALHGEARTLLAEQPRATMLEKFRIWNPFGRQLSIHFSTWLARATHLDLGSQMLKRWLHLHGWYYNPRNSLGEKEDGWVPAPLDYQIMPADVRQRYAEAYAARLAQPAEKVYFDPVSQSAIDRSFDAIDRAGAHAVFFVPPMATDQIGYPSEERSRAFTILDFSDVHQYPELFVPEHRGDYGHVNTAGAEILSAILARRFVELVKSHPPAP